MRIIVTGNMGYVGPVVVSHLRACMPDAELIGYDAGFFAHCLTSRGPLPETRLDRQHFGDIREFPAALLAGVDAVIHLAAISNDPMGREFEAATASINCDASLRLARLAADAEVGHFVFASSCSVYGFAEGGRRTEQDAVNPLTAYARSKIDTERGLARLGNSAMTITALRFATACGMSPRLRLDLVLNDFAACAMATGQIAVLSDGSPWRPLIDVSDMARAIEWAATRSPDRGGRVLVVNAGSDDWNVRVRDLAYATAEQFPGVFVSINREAPPDHRSYEVDFGLFRELAPEHQPRSTLTESISRLREGLQAIAFGDGDFRNSDFIRLNVLRRLQAAGRAGADLRPLH